jgi:hypothetical protein
MLQAKLSDGLDHVPLYSTASTCAGRRGGRAALGALRAIRCAFGKIAERPGRHLAIAVEIHRAFDLETELIEIVPVAGRGKVALKLPNIKLEVAGRARLTVKQVPVMKSAAAILQAAFPFHLIGMDDLHGHYPSGREILYGADRLL